MTLLPTTQQRFTACVAIMAVLLLFVAPVVSKSLAERHQMSRLNITTKLFTLPPDTSSSEIHHHRAAMQMQHAEISAMTMNHTAMPDGEFTCGYCELLVHVPLMLWVFTPFIWLMVLISRAPPIFTPRAPAMRQSYRSQHSRAPPSGLSGTTS